MSELICPRCRQPGPGPRCALEGAYMVAPEVLQIAARDGNIGARVAERYGIIDRLGTGGMGAVYKAVDERTGATVAIKFLREQYARHKAIRTRFVREAEAGASIDNPHVVRLIDFGIDADGTLWIVMEHVRGWTLRDEVNRNGPFGCEAITQMARQVLFGLAAAHDAGLIHRDLKHDNIMFCGTRQNFIARVLDFGVVKSAVADQELRQGPGELTAAGVLVGSPSYMSPEQIRGLTVGPPADLYALAVVMYEALTARRLFSVNNYEALLKAGAERDAPPLTRTGTGEAVPPALNRLLQRALAHDPADRFPDARTMLLALDQMGFEDAAPPVDLLADTPSQPVPLEDAPAEPPLEPEYTAELVSPPQEALFSEPSRVEKPEPKPQPVVEVPEPEPSPESDPGWVPTPVVLTPPTEAVRPAWISWATFAACAAATYGVTSALL